MIPKVIHYCWFGGNPKSDLANKCIASWRKFCPDYKVVEWNEENYDIVSAPAYVQQAYEAKMWAFVSDYVRLDVVYRYGGVYLDTDVELIKNIDGLLCYNGFFGYQDSALICTGIGFGAVERLNILYDLMQDYWECSFVNEDGTYDLVACPIRNAHVFHKYGASNEGECRIIDNNILILPQDYLCPINYRNGKMDITSNTLSVHWFSASWHDKETKIYTEHFRKAARIIGEHNADILLGSISCINNEGIIRYIVKRVKKYLMRN